MTKWNIASNAPEYSWPTIGHSVAQKNYHKGLKTQPYAGVYGRAYCPIQIVKDFTSVWLVIIQTPKIITKA